MSGISGCREYLGVRNCLGVRKFLGLRMCTYACAHVTYVCLRSCCVFLLVFMLRTCACVHVAYFCKCSCYVRVPVRVPHIAFFQPRQGNIQLSVRRHQILLFSSE